MLKFYSQTDIGLIRETNQDSFYINYLDENSIFAVVCDGMGGVNGGSVASNLAVESIKKYIINSYEQFSLDELNMKNLLLNAIQSANLAIYEKSKEVLELAGMGTTVVLVIINNGIIYVAHAGDSRAYILNKECIKQITTDHSIVQEMVENGEITEEQAMNHPRKNIITRALGVNNSIQIDYNELPFKSSDSVLICTDGLTNYVKENDMYKFFNETNSENLINKLICEAKALGGSDNITAIVING